MVGDDLYIGAVGCNFGYKQLVRGRSIAIGRSSYIYGVQGLGIVSRTM